VANAAHTIRGGWPPQRPGPAREHELRACRAALGVTEHHLLGIVDGACAGAPHDPIGRPLARIVDIVAPDTIVTLGPDGMTGPKDHQAVSAWATAHAVAAPDARLRYAATTAEFLRAWGPARDDFDVFLADGLALRTPAADLAVALRLDSARIDRKIVALRARARQDPALSGALGEERVQQWWSSETFVAADTARSRMQEWA
jgi:LmbE family N-acetylglucosaminyl deacetylase